MTYYILMVEEEARQLEGGKHSPTLKMETLRFSDTSVDLKAVHAGE
jgi:hypothetical protein